jgi:hypothetical protein
MELLFLLHAIIFGSFSAFMAGQKNRDKVAWFVLGVVFSFLAIIVLVGLPKLSNPMGGHPGDPNWGQFGSGPVEAPRRDPGVLDAGNANTDVQPIHEPNNAGEYSKWR